MAWHSIAWRGKKYNSAKRARNYKLRRRCTNRKPVERSGARTHVKKGSGQRYRHREFNSRMRTTSRISEQSVRGSARANGRCASALACRKKKVGRARQQSRQIRGRLAQRRGSGEPEPVECGCETHSTIKSALVALAACPVYARAPQSAPAKVRRTSKFQPRGLDRTGLLSAECALQAGTSFCNIPPHPPLPLILRPSKMNEPP